MISMLVYLSFLGIVLYFAATSLNSLRISSMMHKILSFLNIQNGIFKRPSKYWRALDPESSFLAFISFNLDMAFSFTLSGTFNKQICCSSGIFPTSKLESSFVYCTVFFIASRKYCLTDHGKLSNRMVCS